MTTPLLQGPSGVFALSTDYDEGTGMTTVEMVRTPSGAWKVLAGLERLEQDARLFLLTPVGSDPLNPTWGNQVLDFLGEALDDPTIVQRPLLDSLKQFQAWQAIQAKQGYLTPDEQADHFDVNSTTIFDVNGLHTLAISLTVTSKTGQSVTTGVSLPLAT
jgi:hypothetical protein